MTRKRSHPGTQLQGGWNLVRYIEYTVVHYSWVPPRYSYWPGQAKKLSDIELVFNVRGWPKLREIKALCVSPARNTPDYRTEDGFRIVLGHFQDGFRTVLGQVEECLSPISVKVQG